VLAAATDGKRLVALRDAALDVLPLPGTSRRRTTWKLPATDSYGADRPVSCLEGPQMQARCQSPAASLTDLDGRFAVLVIVDKVVLLDLDTGRKTIVARMAAAAQGPLNAQLEPSGLYVSAGSRLTFTPRSLLQPQLKR
jgi:hypothetical protein